MKKLLEGIDLTDRISVPTQRTMTDAGQMIVPAAFARTGTMIYSASSLKLSDRKPDEPIEVHRKEEDVFATDSMETFRSAPVTIGHPKDDNGNRITVDAENAKNLQVGMLEGMPTRDEDLLTGTLVITTQEAIDKIEEGTVELSAGYTCDIYSEDGIFYQRNIKANHIAIVDKGRAGSSCSIADVADEDVADVNDEVEDKTTIKDITDEFNAKVEDEKVAEAVATEDLSEAEAAEAVANYEEAESESDKMEAEHATAYAEDATAWAKAHAEVAKAARKIANKKAKSMNDSADEGGDYNLADDVTSIIVALDVADETISKLEADLVQANDALESEVEARCNVILLAKDMTDMTDFAGKSVSSIKSLVVADVLDIDLSDKSEAYVEARFDILCEDTDNSPTPMGQLLKKQVLVDAKPVVYSNPADEARKKMIERNKTLN